jgi:ABC-type branched-subunit amino acid transport system ATPase component
LLVIVVLTLPRGLIPAVSARWAAWRTGGRTAEVGTVVDAQGPVPLFVFPRQRQEATAGNAPAILEVRDLSKRFGGLEVLGGCSFAVPAGSVTGLIGPNGSGKTTAFNIDGSMPANGGDVYFDRKKVTSWQPWRRSHAGLARTFQITRIFPELTVQENLLAPLRGTSLSSMLSSAGQGGEVDRAHQLLEYVGLERYAAVKTGAMSYGQRKLVEFA